MTGKTQTSNVTNKNDPRSPQLSRLHRQPQHSRGNQSRHRGHLCQIRQDCGLLCAQGLRLRSVCQREERQVSGGRGERQGH
ncbi:unnamed protein product, partial [Lampetra planeri]